MEQKGGKSASSMKTREFIIFIISSTLVKVVSELNKIFYTSIVIIQLWLYYRNEKEQTKKKQRQLMDFF